jgi:hypothetical protein
VACVFTERTFGLALTLGDIPLDDHLGVCRYEELISQGLGRNQSQWGPKGSARCLIVAFVRTHVVLCTQEYQGMMAHPKGDGHVLSRLFIFAKIMPVVGAGSQPDTDFVFSCQPAPLHGRVIEAAVAVKSKNKAFGDIPTRVHAVVQGSRQAPHVNFVSLFYHLFDRCILTGDRDRFQPLLHSLVA